MGLVKAKLVNAEKGGAGVECLFNPTEYTITKSNGWSQKPIKGKDVPPMEFNGGQARTMNLELFFDTYEKGGNVRDAMQYLWDLVMTEAKTKDSVTGRERPPQCIFSWGGSWEFRAVVESLTVKYTLFRENGEPVRATATMTLKEAPADKKKPTDASSKGLAGLKKVTVKPKDTLPSIAHESLGDSGRWREIADENEIDDPMSVTPGQTLRIPAKS